MKYLPITLVLICCIWASTEAYCQDTLSVYFESGSSRILSNQTRVLDNISTIIDTSSLVSVQFIGRTDTVGNPDTNLKLSLKRANEVAKYCKKKLPDNIQILVAASGEEIGANLKENRRVDLIFVFSTDPIDYTQIIEKEADVKHDLVATLTDDTTKHSLEKRCYYIDYNLLAYSHITEITKNRKPYLLIETQMPIKKNITAYTATRDANGNPVPLKVKWSQKRTGEKWWSKSRNVATVPKADFYDYKVFTIDTLPCKKCSLDFPTESVTEDSMLLVAHFLMQNLQARQRLFSLSSITVRVPRAYVDTSTTYYYGCARVPIIWQEKGGKRAKQYYYTQLSVHNSGNIANITQMKTVCKANPPLSDCNSHLYGLLYCGYKCLDYPISLSAEAGYLYRGNTHTPYIGLLVDYEKTNYGIGFWVASDHNFTIYTQLRYRQFLYKFNGFTPFPVWQSPTEIHPVYRYSEVYLGTNLTNGLTQNGINNILEHKAFVGISTSNSEHSARFTKFFLETGIAADYLWTISPWTYPFVQVGANFTFFRFNKQFKQF